MNRHDDSIRLALSRRRSRRSRGRLAWHSRYLRRQSRAIVGGHISLGDCPLERRPLGLGSFRWAEPTLLVRQSQIGGISPAERAPQLRRNSHTRKILRHSEPTHQFGFGGLLRDWLWLFLAGALRPRPEAVSSGGGTSTRFVPRPGGLVSVKAADSRRCRSWACASEMSESGRKMMAQKASKKLPICATFLAFPRHSRWLANDVFYTHGLEAPI
jgi:hypothetical protein